MRNKISVLMAVYNGDKYLKEAIDSILFQTYKNFELIIVNDGSTDKSKDIIESYYDKRIKLINNIKNEGLIFSLNIAIEFSTGDFIARMDADDISKKNRFKIQLKYLQKHPEIGMIGSYIRFFGNCKKRIYKVETNPEVIKADLLFKTGIPHPTVMIRKKVIDTNHLRYNEDFTHAEDMELWLRCSEVTNISNIKKVLLNYRIHANNITNFANKKYSKREDIYKKIHKRSLIKIGIFPNENEITIHRKICDNSRIKSVNEMMCIIKWLSKLEKSNRESRVIEIDAFNYVLNKRLLFVLSKSDNINVLHKFRFLNKYFKTKKIISNPKKYLKAFVPNLRSN